MLRGQVWSHGRQTALGVRSYTAEIKQRLYTALAQRRASPPASLRAAAAICSKCHSKFKEVVVGGAAGALLQRTSSDTLNALAVSPAEAKNTMRNIQINT